MMSQIANLAELESLLAELPDSRKVAALFVNFTNVSQDEWLNPLAASLRDAGFLTIGILTRRSEGKCCLDNCDYLVTLEPAEIARLGRVNAFLMSDMDHSGAIFPQESKVIGICHALREATDGALASSVAFSALFDVWLCPFPLSQSCRQKTAALYTNFASAEASPRKNGEFRIVPAGYPRLGLLSRRLAEYNQTPDTIVFAPSRVNYMLERGGNRLAKYGERTIRLLLESFPDYKVIFRPYREDENSPEVAALRAGFAGERRFLIDLSPDRFFSFSHGACLITDFSHISRSFAFTTLRPAINYEPWFGDSPKGEWAGGYDCHNESDLVAAVRQSLAEPEQMNARIASQRDRLLMPFENALEQVASIATDLCADKSRPEWLTIPRCQTAPDELDLLRRAASEPAAAGQIAVAASVYAMPESPLLAAFALGQQMASNPQGLYYLPFRDVIGNLLGQPPACYRYGMTDWAIVKKLYAMALARSARASDRVKMKLIEDLMG